MPPAFRSATSNNTGTFNNFPISKPSGVVDGDLLIVALETYDASGSMAHGTPPAGWTLVRTLNATGGPMRASVYRKIAASEPSSWTFLKTNDSLGYGGCIACIAVSDPATPSTPLSAENGAIDASGDAGVDAPSITPASADDLLVYIGAIRQQGAFGPPTGYTERVDVNDSNQGQSLTIATKTAGSTAATGTVTATNPGFTAEAAGFLLAVAGAPPAAAFTPQIMIVS